ncbi:hypothetical protein JWG39_09775 [Desulforhopalus vacuolatus]|uniref:EH signature domain-containing protein n=1 Tax=Desulforhopalus vacuolatus TaxID=40414 RepID=UPI0019653D9E|nr:EH signature domain-containing protein [Desulforhopalus vacuolatus]MBM9520102.1 hypothetical protein [Desulforhopalus vacuolatus]
MINFHLPEFTLDLPDIADENCTIFFEALTQRLDRYVKKVGKTDVYQRRREKLLTTVLTGNDIRPAIDGPGYIRPLFELWATRENFLLKVPPDKQILAVISDMLERTVHRRLGRLALREACQLFFKRYDIMGNGLEPFCDFLRQQLNRYEKKELLFGLDLLHGDATNIISPRGHVWLAEQAVMTGLTLPDVADQRGIPLLNSRLFEASQQIFYLQRIRALKPNQIDDILFEVRNAKVHRAPCEKGKMLGHPVVMMLIDKLTGYHGEPADQWLKTILAIAGDPRIPSSHRNYREWWSHFGVERIRQMRRWLSRMDMELFLDIVKEFSERKGEEEMRRMFPKRKRFLEGLFQKKLVQDTQLFLSAGPEKYLRKRFSSEEQLPHFHHLVGPSSKLAIFYFRMGDVHLVEGTHTFALSIMDKLPDNSPLGKYDTNRVYQRALGIGLQEEYYNQFGESINFARIIHNSQWIEKAYNQLTQLGISIAPQDIMDSDDYKRMIGV